MKVTGEFEVSLSTTDFSLEGKNGISFGRMVLDKKFHGELEATSKGEMLSAMTPVKGSAGYVAMEHVEGTLSGKEGSFVLLHFGTIEKGKDKLILEVVPDSGAGGLAGLSGKMEIRIKDGKHFYEFEYELA